MNNEELDLLNKLKSPLTKEWGIIGILYFSASFFGQEDWICRLEYTSVDDNIKGLFLQGSGDTIQSASEIKPRVIFTLPSVATTRDIIAKLLEDGPDYDEERSD